MARQKTNEPRMAQATIVIPSWQDLDTSLSVEACWEAAAAAGATDPPLHPAWPAMVPIARAAIEHWPTDFFHHDSRALSANPTMPGFVWAVGDCGTHFIFPVPCDGGGLDHLRACAHSHGRYQVYTWSPLEGLRPSIYSNAYLWLKRLLADERDKGAARWRQAPITTPDLVIWPRPGYGTLLRGRIVPGSHEPSDRTKDREQLDQWFYWSYLIEWENHDWKERVCETLLKPHQTAETDRAWWRNPR